MTRAMILSVGGSPDPIAFSLREERPEFVCFLASHQSVDQIGGIKQSSGSGTDWSCQDEKEIVESPEDLVECYERALKCWDRVHRRGIGPAETLIDYTGGTKVMSAALAMAAASRGVRFSYVGGTRRTKDGLGVVESGTERRRVDCDPLELFAVEEKRRIGQHFNSCQYDAARTRLDDLLPRLPEPQRSVLLAVQQVVAGYAAWDRFDHRAALRVLGAGRAQLDERARLTGAREYGEVLAITSDNVAALAALDRDTKGFKRLHLSLVGDLVANAERRLAERKFDDAVARLYRAIEMRGQVAFEAAFGVLTNKVRAVNLPEPIRDDYVARYRDAERDVLKLPLEATYRALGAANDPVGLAFAERYDEIRQLQGARNDSILAHGLQPLGEERARRMLEVALAFLPDGVHRPRFPQLPW